MKIKDWKHWKRDLVASVALGVLLTTSSGCASYTPGYSYGYGGMGNGYGAGNGGVGNRTTTTWVARGNAAAVQYWEAGDMKGAQRAARTATVINGSENRMIRDDAYTDSYVLRQQEYQLNTGRRITQSQAESWADPSIGATRGGKNLAKEVKGTAKEIKGTVKEVRDGIKYFRDIRKTFQNW